jgi:hypothetical protein
MDELLFSLGRVHFWLAVLAAVCNFFVRLPALFKMMFRSVTQRLHGDAISDIPGNPHAFDAAIISLFNTLPEPSNLNIVQTNLQLDQPLVARGVVGKSRVSSLSLYGQGSSDPPSSIDLRAPQKQDRGNKKNKQSPGADDPDKFEVLLLGSPEMATQLQADPRPKVVGSGWSKGYIAMRNYLVPAGSRILTPEITRLSDGKVIRSAQVGIAKLDQLL